jgi:hypothetical protein
MHSGKFDPNPNAAAGAELETADGTPFDLSEVRTLVQSLQECVTRLTDQLAAIDGDAKLSDFAMQTMMSDYNAAESLASSVKKKMDCGLASIIAKM